jgi:hypothetical protein
MFNLVQQRNGKADETIRGIRVVEEYKEWLLAASQVLDGRSL